MIPDDKVILCSSCVDLLELVIPSERCPYCFSQNFCSKKRLCEECLKRPPYFNGLAASFDYVGPAASLVQHLKYANKPYLAKGCAAYMTAQLLQLNWPLPDVIIPVPISPLHQFSRGYNQSLLLANELGKIMKIPVEDLIKRHSGDHSQAGLTRSQRMQLNGSTIFLKEKTALQDKTVLLVDDVITTGTTLRKCAEALSEACPFALYGLAFCRALR